MLSFFLILVFCVFGVITGIATGLLPGLHVNNIALILLSLSGAIIAGFSFLFEMGISESFILVLICVFIISTSISHTFHDVIPSTFLGAPDEDMALSVLPAHSLLLEGKVRTPEEIMAGVEKVTLTDIKRISQKLFQPLNFRLAAIGPYRDQKQFAKLLQKS